MTVRSETRSGVAGRLERLRTHLAGSSSVQGESWLESLGERKIEEASFHDRDRAHHRDEIAPEESPNRRFYEAATLVRDHVDDWICRNADGGIFLDYACGNGLQGIAAARAGARHVVGIDISETSVRNATESAATLGVSETTSFLQRDCENTGLPDGCFDAILCSGMLHHLDLSRAFPELHRITAPGGRIYCQEALHYNPVIQMYRNRTPELRTSWEKEHILGLRDVRFAGNWFRVENTRFYLMTAPLATLLPQGPLRRGGLKIGHAIDRVLTRTPFLKYWSWQFSFELVKPA